MTLNKRIFTFINKNPNKLKKSEVAIYANAARLANRRSHASLTVEAALTLPVLLYALMAPMLWMLFFATQQSQQLERNENLKNLSQYAYLTEDLGILPERFMLFHVAELKFIPGSGLAKRMFTERGALHPFIGRKYSGDGEVGEGAADQEEKEVQMVYVTETGTVYHLRLECSYLKLSIEEVLYQTVGMKRNQYGAKYYPCEICADRHLFQAEESVYITSDGNRCHTSLSCHGLIRKIRTCPKEEAIEQGKKACSRCGKEERIRGIGSGNS